MTGAIRRAESIANGRLEYRFESGEIGPNTTASNRLPPKTLTFAGDNWIERDPANGVALLRRGDLGLQYKMDRQRDGSTRHTAIISRASQLPDLEGENRHPRFAGSFWHARQLAYVVRHRAEFRQAKPDNVEGVPCEVCELVVPANDVGNVVSVINPLLATGGTLRVHIAPQLGFALPLVEVTTPDGTPVVSCRSEAWVEVAPDIHFPRETRTELRVLSGRTLYEQFTITASLVNQPLPDSEFVVELPAGTSVRDESDSQKVRRFELNAPTSTDKLLRQNGMPQDVAEMRQSDSSRNLLVALGVAAIAILVCVIAIRYLRTRH